MSKTNHDRDAAQAALNALLVKADSLQELLTHAQDIRESEKVIRDIKKRIARTERLITKAARKLVSFN